MNAPVSLEERVRALAAEWLERPLAQHDAQVAAKALREAADQWEQEDTDAVGDWLRDRADRIGGNRV